MELELGCSKSCHERFIRIRILLIIHEEGHVSDDDLLVANMTHQGLHCAMSR